jgi:serine/threonine-protein kinase RsbT
VTDEERIRVESEADLVTARAKGRELASRLGFGSLDLTLIATAISELGRNVLQYARRGEIILSRANQKGSDGIVIIAQDNGPGIPDLQQAMQDGFSTARGLGMGLPGTKRLMDEFQIISEVNKGTTVTVKKWVKSREPKTLVMALG